MGQDEGMGQWTKLLISDESMCQHRRVDYFSIQAMMDHGLFV